MKLEVKKFGEPILHTKLTNIDAVDNEIKQNLEDMSETLSSFKGGVGIAANQVGIDKRMFVINLQGKVKKFINPIIIEHSNNKNAQWESCLSDPEYKYGVVERFSKIKVKYLTEQNEEVIEELEGLASNIFQHELDHLNGITYQDRAVGKKLYTENEAKELIKALMEQLNKKS